MSDNEFGIKKIESIIESLLFASGDVLSAERISETIGIDVTDVHSIVQSMMDRYEAEDRGIAIRRINDGYQFASNLNNFDHIRKLFEHKGKSTLSQAAYETLAVIAYKQPVTRAKVEQIRGVNSDSAFLKLIERSLIIETGRMDAPGRPILYATTEEFLRTFGFKSIADLPVIDFEGIYGM
jgi:segregation and condensation protein B